MSEPTLRAFVLAEYVNQTKSGTWDVCGIFDTTFVNQVPFPFGCAAYCKIVDMPKMGFVRIDLKDRQGNLLWSSGATKIESDRVGATFEYACAMRGMTPMDYGPHRFELYVGSNYLGCAEWNVERPRS